MKKTRFPYQALLLAPVLALAACGGGGSGGGGNNPPPPTNKPPVAVISPIEGEVLELSTVTLSAAASTDPDGDKLTYSWKQVSGVPIALVAADTAEASFTARKVITEEELVFEVTVSDGSETDRANIDVTISEGEGLVYALLADRHELWRRHASDLQPVLLAATDPPVGDDSGGILSVKISPNRQWISFRLRQPEDRARLYVMSMDGSIVHDVLEGMSNASAEAADYAWLPDSSALIISADGRHENVREIFYAPISVEGSIGNIRPISGELSDFLDADGNPGTDGVPDGGVTGGFRLSPSAERIAFHGRMNLAGEEIFVTDFQGNRFRASGELRDFDQDGIPEGEVGEYFWSHSGHWLAYFEDHDSDDNFEIYVIDVDAPEAGAHKVSDDGDRGDEQVPITPGRFDELWMSPADDKLVFTFNGGVRKSFQLVDLTGDVPKRSTIADPLSPTSQGFEAWSPNGKYFAFSSLGFEDEAGARLFVVEVDEVVGELRNLTGSVVPGGNVDNFRWSPNSNQIAFIGDLVEASRNGLFVTDAEALVGRRHLISSGGPKCTFGSRGIEWSNDSNIILIGGSFCQLSGVALMGIPIENPSATTHFVDNEVHFVWSYSEKPADDGAVFIASRRVDDVVGIYETAGSSETVELTVEYDGSLADLERVVYFSAEGSQVVR